MSVKAVVPIVDAADIPAMLRLLADRIESGEVECNRATVITGQEVRCFGPVSEERAAEQAIFDMTWGIHYVMSYPAKIILEENGW